MDAPQLQGGQPTMTSVKLCITQEQLREAVSYDPSTGEFRRRVFAASMAKSGDIAGTVRVAKSGKAYLTFNVLGVYASVHRWAFLYMTGNMPAQVDHLNGNGCDNRWSNLRAVTNAVNCKNQRLRRTNTSGQHGVTWHKKTKQWAISISVDGRRFHLGYRKSFDEAVKVRKAAEHATGYMPGHGCPRPLFTKAEVAGEWAKHCLPKELTPA